jgi:hypothetical protein
MAASTITIYHTLNFVVNAIMICYMILNYLYIVTFLKDLSINFVLRFSPAFWQ